MCDCASRQKLNNSCRRVNRSHIAAICSLAYTSGSQLQTTDYRSDLPWLWLPRDILLADLFRVKKITGKGNRHYYYYGRIVWLAKKIDTQGGTTGEKTVATDENADVKNARFILYALS